MSDVTGDKDKLVHSDFGLLPEDGEMMGDPSASFCYVCGACLSVCLAAKFGCDFDPREIVLKVRYGMADKLLIDHSVLWQCFRCHRCYEVCPQPVKPVEIIAQLRDMLRDALEPGSSGRGG